MTALFIAEKTKLTLILSKLWYKHSIDIMLSLKIMTSKIKVKNMDRKIAYLLLELL